MRCILSLKISVGLAVLILIAFACHPADNLITQVETDLGPMQQLDLRSNMDSMQLKLSDIAEDFEIIHLETTPESLIAQATFYVGRDYILCMCARSRILQFSRTGKFIQVITTKGQGPNELTNGSWGVDDQISSTLFLIDQPKKNYFLRYDLESGEYIDPISLACPGEYAAVQLIDNETVLCAPVFGSQGKASENLLVWQRTDGQLIHSLPNPVRESKWRIYGAKILHKVGQTIKFRPVNSDTLYAINNMEVRPDWYFKCDNHERQEMHIPIAGEISFFIQVETPRYFILRRSKAAEVVREGRSTSIRNIGDYVFVDKERKSAACFLKLNNDYLGSDYPVYRLKGQSNGLIVMSFEAIDLIQQLEDWDKKDGSTESFNRLSNLCAKINENDNPVLLVGNAK